MALQTPGLSPLCISDSFAAVVVVLVVVGRCRLPLLIVVVVVVVEVMSFIVVVVGFVGVVANVICALIPPTTSMPTPLTPSFCSNLTTCDRTWFVCSLCRRSELQIPTMHTPPTPTMS